MRKIGNPGSDSSESVKPKTQCQPSMGLHGKTRRN